MYVCICWQSALLSVSFCLLPFFVTVLHLFLFSFLFLSFPLFVIPTSIILGERGKYVSTPPPQLMYVCHIYILMKLVFVFPTVYTLYLSVSLSIISICQSVCLSLYICTILTIYLHMKHVALSLNYAGYEIM